MTWAELILKFDENRKFCYFFDVLFQAKSSNAVSACKLQNFTLGPKKSKRQSI